MSVGHHGTGLVRSDARDVLLGALVRACRTLVDTRRNDLDRGVERFDDLTPALRAGREDNVWFRKHGTIVTCHARCRELTHEYTATTLGTLTEHLTGMNSNTIGSIGVIGAGLMGHSIAMNFAAGGHQVVLVDTTDEKLRMAMENVSATLGVLQEQGLVDESTAQAVPGRIRTSTSIEGAMDDVGFVVEAVFEDLDLKRCIFADLDRHCPPHAVLTSNTSSFMTSQIAPSTNRPDKVVVANWWNPAHLLPLVEVVRGPQTSDETIEITKSVLEGIGKRPVLQKESLGFIGNRMQFALLREALSVVDKGIASAEDVDTVVKTGFGRRLAVAGPLEVFDIAGWDTISHIIDELYPDLDTSDENSPTITGMLERGDLGVKSGRGFYEWNDEAVEALRQRITHALAAIDRFD